MKTWIILLVSISAAVSAQEQNCKTTQLGKEFKRRLRVTQSGKCCREWGYYMSKVNNNDFPEGSLYSAKRYCRNPSDQAGISKVGGPWCYTNGDEWEYCDVPLCGEKNCKTTQLGMEYVGKMAFTNESKDCQRWDSQSPHNHSLYNDAKDFPDATLTDAANYCRNPNVEPGKDVIGDGPWCYTTDPKKRWQYCTVPLCEDTSEKNTEEVVLLIGGHFRGRYITRGVHMITEDLKANRLAFPGPKSTRLGVGLIDNKVVACYGWSSDKLSFCAELYLDELTWHDSPISPTKPKSYWSTTAVHNGSLYFIGGYKGSYPGDPISRVEKYDGTKWSPAKAMPESSLRHCTVGHKDFIYIIGGKKGNAEESPKMYRFDPSSGVYVNLASMKMPRRDHMCAVVKIGDVEGILVAGGQDKKLNYLGSTEFYSFKDREWRTLADLNTARSRGGLAYLGGRPVVFGGYNRMTRGQDSMEVYDEDLKKWRTVEERKLPRTLYTFGYVKVPAHMIGYQDKC